MQGKEKTTPADWIKNAIREFTPSAENSLGGREHEPAWSEPLTGFSRGDDPLYLRFKDDIGDFYWTPLEIFEKTFPALKVTAAELTVISWILPQTEKTIHDNRNEKERPSKRWARSRKFGEEFNVRLREQVVALLRGRGYEAVAPANSPYFEIQTSARFGPASTWSERHAAYVVGLGSLRLPGKPCAAVQLLPAWASRRRRVPMTTLTRTASFFPGGPAAHASSAVPQGRSAGKGTIKSAAWSMYTQLHLRM